MAWLAYAGPFGDASFWAHGVTMTMTSPNFVDIMASNSSPHRSGRQILSLRRVAVEPRYWLQNSPNTEMYPNGYLDLDEKNTVRT